MLFDVNNSKYSKTCYEHIGGSFVYKMSFWGMIKWPPIGGWLLIKVADHSRFYCMYNKV